ncbi:hypothetical protein HanOQP8_Chr12g0452981 [Helianthus annuus]|nr:hypothetical protein HanOQP8_Chr12g0452981 [Helianthus annuus]
MLINSIIFQIYILVVCLYIVIDGSYLLDAKADTIWPLLEAKYPYLKTIQDKRAKAWIMSQKIKNPETNLFELASDSHETIERLVSRCV